MRIFYKVHTLVIVCSAYVSMGTHVPIILRICSFKHYRL